VLVQQVLSGPDFLGLEIAALDLDILNLLHNSDLKFLLSAIRSFAEKAFRSQIQVPNIPSILILRRCSPGIMNGKYLRFRTYGQYRRHHQNANPR
jgi:hypothetical protein